MSSYRSVSRRRLLGSGAALSVTGLAAAACGGGSGTPKTSTSSTPTTSGIEPSTAPSGGSPGPSTPTDVDPGGILYLLNEEPFEHLDPQNIYVSNSESIGRLMFRTLMGWREDPAAGTFTLVPDLAAAMPTPTADNSVWTFRLRPGIRYADGTAVTAADIKYGVERSMDPNIPYGPQYAKQYLVGAADYGGPSKGALASIAVPDAQTIVFHLVQPVGTWAELCTLYTFTPVPRARDTGKTYDLHPVCLGPYTIRSYDQSTKLTLDPNPHWDSSTDPLRSQFLKQIVVTMNVNGSTVDEELFTDGQGGALATFDSPQPANIARAISPTYAARRYTATTPGIAYTQVSTTQRALKDQRVRQALVYADDPQAEIQAAGGSALNAIATSLVPPQLPGWGHVRNYYPDLGPHGNPAKAKALLHAAGVTDLRVTAPGVDDPESARAVQIPIAAYARAGITYVPKPIGPSNYFTTIANPANHFDLYPGSWEYDIPDPSTIFPPLFRGGTNLYNGSANFAGTNIPSLDAQMAAALKLPPQQALPLWMKVNQFLIEQAIAVPNAQSKVVNLVGSRVRGAYISPVLGNLDVTNAYIART
jgi:peptide/nickel transport system substrate-binding protein